MANNIYNKTNEKEWKEFYLKWHDKHEAYCYNNGICNEDETIYMLGERLKQAEEEIERLQKQDYPEHSTHGEVNETPIEELIEKHTGMKYKDYLKQKEHKQNLQIQKFLNSKD
jgi:hypothetical protein